MTLALICTEVELEDVLADTVLWRESVERRSAASFEEAQDSASDLQPGLVLIDRDAPWAERLVRSLRQDLQTRRLSVAVLARGDFDPSEVDLLEAGANAILRLPPGPGWDDRVTRLIQVPTRREARFPVFFEIEAQHGVRSAAATAVNLSVRGMLIESSFPLRVGDDIDFRFKLPESEDPIVGTAQVVRIGPRGRYGVEFYGIEGRGDELVRQFVGELPAS
jgi:CheY-like chemotaxis protein